MKRTVLVLLAMLLCVCTVAAQAVTYYSEAAVTVNGDVITPAELAEAIQALQIRSAITYAELDKDYAMLDTLNIIDALSKTLFDLEQGLILRQQAEALGVSLTDAEWKQVKSDAHAEWIACRMAIGTDNVLAHMPAGKYTPLACDPEETVCRYLSSFGLTEERLIAEAELSLLDTKLREAVCADLPDATPDERFEHYIDWLLARMDEADIVEDPVAIAEVCVELVK